MSDHFAGHDLGTYLRSPYMLYLPQFLKEMWVIYCIQILFPPTQQTYFQQNNSDTGASLGPTRPITELQQRYFMVPTRIRRGDR